MEAVVVDALAKTKCLKLAKRGTVVGGRISQMHTSPSTPC